MFNHPPNASTKQLNNLYMHLLFGWDPQLCYLDLSRMLINTNWFFFVFTINHQMPSMPKVGRAKGPRTCWVGEEPEVFDQCIQEAKEACMFINLGRLGTECMPDDVIEHINCKEKLNMHNNKHAWAPMVYWLRLLDFRVPAYVDGDFALCERKVGALAVLKATSFNGTMAHLVWGWNSVYNAAGLPN